MQKNGVAEQVHVYSMIALHPGYKMERGNKMYKLERTRKYKLIFGVLAFVFFVLFIRGFMRGGAEIIIDGFMSEPLPSIVMVSSLLCSIICLLCFLVVNALEKDISEWLKIIDQQNK